MTLIDFMENKPLFYKKIDFKRMHQTYEAVREKLPLSLIIHIVGTNGKGSTGRWLALMLHQAGFTVGHYTSPHIFSFNERFWINGAIVDDTSLEKAHQKLFKILTQERAEALSYFEYATFLAAVLFENCHYVIFEAGLGGEHDATNVFPKKLSIVTTIDFDHKDFLGDTLKQIATTKLNSIETTTILSKQKNKEVVNIAKNIANKKNISLLQADITCKESDIKNIQKYCNKHNYVTFFVPNIQTAYVSALKLGVTANLDTLKPLDLRGRFEKIKDNIIVDVGHNPLSAKKIAENFPDKSIILVYNSFEDKDIESILKILSPITLHVKILPIHDDARRSGEDIVKNVAKKLHLPWSYFGNIIQEDKKYLVFGSFYLVEKFLKRINEE